jgi:hypothetical protein
LVNKVFLPSPARAPGRGFRFPVVSGAIREISGNARDDGSERAKFIDTRRLRISR